jgi:uncharacterized membrane protein
MDYYFWIKSAHIIAVITFIGGMILNGFLLRYLVAGEPQSDRIIKAARFWNGPIIGMALLLVWVLGLWLAYLGNYFSDVWLMIKMTLVFILSGIHGMQAGAFRRLQQSPPRPVSGFLRNSAAVTIGFIAVIVVLVITQPFQ